MRSLPRFTALALGAAVAGALTIGYALAHEAGQQHAPDPNSPSDVMMEQCLGPEGHTQVGGTIDQMHGEGAHHRVHRFVDEMSGGMMGGGAGARPGRMGPGGMGPGMMGPGIMGGMMGRGQPGPGMGPGMMMGPRMMGGMLGRGI